MKIGIKAPRQKRSRETYNRIISFGADLLIKSSHEGFSIAELSRVSGVSVGSIYQRFENKEKLYLVLQGKILDELDAIASQRFDTDDIQYADKAEAVADAVERFADHVSENETLLRMLILRGLVDAEANARGHQSSIHVGRLFKAHLRLHLGSGQNPDSEMAYDMCFRVVFSCLWRQIVEIEVPEAEIEINWSDLVAQLSAMCQAYLLRA